MNRRLFPALLLALAMVGAALASPSEAAVPSERQWVSDTYRAMVGSRAWIDTRVAHGGTKLAVNLDIDNTSLATYYDRGHAVAATLRFVRYARSKGVSILFNSGRNVSLRTSTIAQLRRAGYPVDGLCLHYAGEPLSHSKQRCRASFVRNGFTIIANVGNRSTDFTGGSYERAFRLPSYGNRLG